MPVIQTQQVPATPLFTFPGRLAAAPRLGRPFPILSETEAFFLGPIVSFVLAPFLHRQGISWDCLMPLLCLLGMTGAQLVHSALVRKQDLFSPLNFAALYFLVYFVARAYFILTSSEAELIGRQPYLDSLPAALWCACLGYVALFAGFRCRFGQVLLSLCPSLQVSWPRRIPTLRLCLLGLAGFASMLYMFSIGQSVGVTDNFAFVDNPPPGIVVLLAGTVNIGLTASCVYLFSRKSLSDLVGLRAPLLLSLIFVLSDVATSGQKEALLSPVCACLIAYNYLRKRLRMTQLLALSFPLLFLTFGAINTYRFVIGKENGPPRSLAEVGQRLVAASDYFRSGDTSPDQSSAGDMLLNRQAGVDALAVVMKYTPTLYPFGYGRNFIQIPIQTLVPRQLWPDKPIYTPNLDFERSYLRQPWNINGATSMHLISDLYKEFKLYGVFFGLFSLGVFLRFLYLACNPYFSALGILYYALLIPDLTHGMEADVSLYLNSAFRETFLIWAATLFMGVRYRFSRSAKG